MISVGVQTLKPFAVAISVGVQTLKPLAVAISVGVQTLKPLAVVISVGLWRAKNACAPKPPVILMWLPCRYLCSARSGGY